MTTKSKVFLIVGVAFAGMIVLIVGGSILLFFGTMNFGAQRMVELDRKRSAETFGTITYVSQYRSSGSPKYGGGLNSKFNIQYVVNGVTYNEEKTRSGYDGDEKKQGLKIQVCYDPSDPASLEFYYLQDNKTCGK